MACTCGAVEQLDCACSFVDSDTILVDGSGNGTPLTFSWNIDETDDNLLECQDDGLLAQLPTELQNQPSARIWKSSNQSLTDNVGTRVAFNSQVFDTDNMWTASPNPSRLTIVTEGVYVFTFNGNIAANVLGDRSAHLRRNGNEYVAGSNRFTLVSATLPCGLNVVYRDFFEVGEYIEVYVKQDSGGALNLLSSDESPILTAKRRRMSPL